MSLFATQRTPQGYVRVSLTQIKTALENIWKGALGSDVDLDARSADGQIIGGLTEMFDDLNAAVLDGAVNTGNPNGATGAALTNLAKLTGLTRGAAVPGVAIEEPDPLLRIRRMQSVAIPTTALCDRLQGALMAIPHVTQAIVRENDTGAAVSIGTGTIAANSLLAIVATDGDPSVDPTETGDAADPVANAIFALKGTGCATQGTTTKHPLDVGGIPHAINYQLATALAVSVQVNVSKRYNWPSDGESQIVAAVLAWGVAKNANGKPNCPINGDDKGELSWTDVLASFLNAVPGFDFTSIKFSVDGGSTWGTANTNLTIPFGAFALIAGCAVNAA